MTLCIFLKIHKLRTAHEKDVKVIRSLVEGKKKMESDMRSKKMAYDESMQSLQEFSDHLRKIVMEFKLFVKV